MERGKSKNKQPGNAIKCKGSGFGSEEKYDVSSV